MKIPYFGEYILCGNVHWNTSAIPVEMKFFPKTVFTNNGEYTILILILFKQQHQLNDIKRSIYVPRRINFPLFTVNLPINQNLPKQTFLNK